MPHQPFTDSTQVSALYADGDRVAKRTAALHAAKVQGGNATEQIAVLAGQNAALHPVVLNIGCGRGSTTLALATRLRSTQLLAVDKSAALLAVTRQRTQAAGHRVQAVCGDFHQLPLPDQTVDVAVAASCLYHSPRAQQAITEIVRCLCPGRPPGAGHQVRRQLPRTRPTPRRHRRRPQRHQPTQPVCDLQQRERHRHRRRRRTRATRGSRTARLSVRQPHHLATYLATTPKYQLPVALADPAALASGLGAHLPAFPVTATSTVTYMLATRP